MLRCAVLLHAVPAGVSHLLEYMAFKTTKSRTHLRLVREVEAIGGNVLASGEQGKGAGEVGSRDCAVRVAECGSTSGCVQGACRAPRYW